MIKFRCRGAVDETFNVPYELAHTSHTHTHTCVPRCSNMGMFTYKSRGMLARGMMVWWQTTLRWEWAKWKKMQCQRLMSSRPEQTVPLFLPLSSWLKKNKSYVMHTCTFKLCMSPHLVLTSSLVLYLWQEELLWTSRESADQMLWVSLDILSGEMKDEAANSMGWFGDVWGRSHVMVFFILGGSINEQHQIRNFWRSNHLFLHKRNHNHLSWSCLNNLEHNLIF